LEAGFDSITSNESMYVMQLFLFSRLVQFQYIIDELDRGISDYEDGIKNICLYTTCSRNRCFTNHAYLQRSLNILFVTEINTLTFCHNVDEYMQWNIEDFKRLNLSYIEISHKIIKYYRLKFNILYKM
jgi:hypothetical protein